MSLPVTTLTRMWLASQWTVRNEFGWLLGQEEMYKHLIDGSRAANLLGWQWTVGTGTGKPYGFARWQVQKRASELCMGCARLMQNQFDLSAPGAVRANLKNYCVPIFIEPLAASNFE